MTPTEKILLIAVMVGCGVIVILIGAFTFLSTPLQFRKPDLHAPRTAVELEGVREMANTRETRSRWIAKGSKMKVRYR